MKVVIENVSQVMRRSAAVGAAVWVAALPFVQPSPFETVWARFLLLLAPLVLVPLGLSLLDREVPVVGPQRKAFLLCVLLQRWAALLLGFSMVVPERWPAVATALPWLLVTGLLASFGVLRLQWRRPRPLADLCVDAGLLYILVGAVWAVLDRLEARPLGFEPVIVLLTAIHFHYAGFALPLMTGFALRSFNGPLARAAGGGVIAGIPLVALGITASQLRLGFLLECLAAWILAAAGLLVAWFHLRLAARPEGSPLARALWALAAVSLAGSMILAALYGTRFYFPIPWLDIPWMRALHGSANAFGFGLAGMLGWVVDERRRPTLQS